MCILKIEKSIHDDSLVFVNADPNDPFGYDIEELYNSLKYCGFKDMTITSFGSLDNCIVFN